MLDGLKNIINNDKQVQSFGNLGGLVSSILQLVFMLAGILMFVWALMGIFQYITAGGNKEGLAKARARITWAIVGFLFIVIAFSLSRYIQEFIIPNNHCTAELIRTCEINFSRCIVSNGKAQCE